MFGKLPKLLILLITAGIISLAFSCSDYSPVDLSGSPTITGHGPEVVVSGETIKLIGSHFGESGPMSKLIFNDTTTITSDECQSWNSSLIEFILPRELTEARFIVAVGNETSTEYKVEVRLYPEIEMIDVSAGTFQMGSERGLNNELPIHSVTLTRDFLISKYEIDQRTYEIVIGENNSSEINRFYPADNISWMEAIQFCNKLSEMDELDPSYTINGEDVTFDYSANGYRLPTEAEWEYTCRAGSDALFAGNGVLLDMGWFNGNSGYKEHKPGGKLANDWDIFDMHGNVWEWCWDFDQYDYYSSSPGTDPTGPATGDTRIIRGGCCLDGENYCRSSNRTFFESGEKRCGIRLVKNK
jgi:formylglycine-generating enzyme required for sulfatase activity